MDAGQIFACFIAGGILMVFTKLSVELIDQNKTFTERTKMIIEYIATVIGVVVIFSVGLMVGRQ